MRTPDELFDVLDLAQADLDRVHPNAYDLRSLLWEFIADIRETFTMSLNHHFSESVYELTTTTINAEIDDYLVNHYGDD